MKDISQTRQQIGGLLNAGRLEEAKAACRQALSGDPGHPDLLTLYGHVLVRSDDLSGAETQFRVAVDTAPDAAITHQALTDFLLAQGQAKEALKSARLALKADPDDALGFVMLARAAAQNSLFNETQRMLARLRPRKLPTPQSQLAVGVLHHLMGDAGNADRYFKAARQHFRNDAEYLTMLGVIAELNQNWRLTITCLQELLQKTPGQVELCDRLADLYTRLNMEGEAVDAYRPVMEQRDDAESHYRFAHFVSLALGDLDEIETHARRALELDENHDGANGVMARVCAYRGDLEKAREYVDRALELEPGNHNIFLTLGDLVRLEPGHPSFAAVEARLRETQDDYLSGYISKALGKMYASIGDYDRAFDNFRRGNEARGRAALRSGISYVPAILEGQTALKARIFTSEFVEALSDCASDSDLPVFIVGLPRSGTSLLEQILSGHSRIAGAGELVELNEVSMQFERLLELRGEDAAADILRANAEAWRERYMSALVEKAKKSDVEGVPLRIIDKLPTNFRHLNLIAILFPRARIINLARDPLAVGLSIYTNSFKLGHTYATDLRNIGHFYNTYLAQIEHCRRALPLRLIDASYENLVTDTETQLRALIDFLDLEWEDQCLAFEGGTGEIRTLSMVQARNRINNASIDTWKKYEKHLGPLVEAVGPESLAN